MPEELGFDPQKLRRMQERDEKRAQDAANRQAAMICYYYPQYTLEQAVDMPIGDALLLLQTALLIENENRTMQLSIAGAAQSKKAYTKLMKKLDTQRKKLESN